MVAGYTKRDKKAAAGHKRVVFWYEQLSVLNLRYFPIFPLGIKSTKEQLPADRVHFICLSSTTRCELALQSITATSDSSIMSFLTSSI